MRREPHRKMRRIRISVCRRSASPSFLREDKSKWRVVDREERFSQFVTRLARNPDADRVVRMGRAFSPSPGGGGSRTAGARGGARGDAGIRSALRALSPHPAALRAATFPPPGEGGLRRRAVAPPRWLIAP